MSGSTNGGPGAWEPPSVEELHGLLPQYEIESILGKGGMGAVYKGKQATLRRAVAIKVLPEFLAEGGNDLQYVERFKLEARSMASLDHPAIISVFDFGQTEKGHLFFVMEFIDGMDIENYIRAAGGVVDPEHAVAITSHVLDALEYAHSKGMIHRDIKPANVLINHEGRVKIADFGLVKQLAGEDAAELSALTMEDVAMGTPDYIAPEALEMSGTPDHRADLYAVGVMLYKMLTGKLPRGLFKMPSEESDSLDPRFDDIITLAMESNPEGRFQNATEFRSKLDELQSEPVDRIGPDQVSGEVSPAVSGSVVNAGATNPPSSSPAPKMVRTGASRKSPPQTRSSGIGFGFTLLGVFSVLAVACYFLLFPKDNGDEISEASKREMPPPENELETSVQEVDLTAVTPETNPSESRVTEVTESTPRASITPEGQTALEFEIKTVRGTQFHCWRGEKTELQLLSSDWTADDIAPFILLLDDFQRLIEEMSGLDLSGPESELLTIFETGGWIPMGTNGDPRVGLPTKETEESIRQLKQDGKTPHFYISHLASRIKFDYISKLDFPHGLRNSHSTNAIGEVLRARASEKLNLTSPYDHRKYGNKAFETFKEIPISWEEAIEGGSFKDGDQKVSIRLIYHYIYLELISKVGVEEFFKPFIEKLASLPDTKNAQDAIDNFYTAATHAAGSEATEFLLTDMRMPVSDSLR